MALKHKKTETVADPTQADLNAQIALGNYPTGTLLTDIVLGSDWNDTHVIDSGGLTFTPNASPTYSAWTIVADSGNRSFTAYNADSNVAMQIGKEGWMSCTNKTGVTIPNGAPVYINGFDVATLMPTIALASNTTQATVTTVGVATETIANNAVGEVTVWGDVRGVDTSAFVAGVPIYVGSTAGTLTTTKPVTGFIYQVGVVGTSNATTGYLRVAPSLAVSTSGASPTIGAYSVSSNNTNAAAAPTGNQTIIAGTPGFTPTVPAAAQFTGSASGSYQYEIQNTSTNAAASTDFVATADNGTDTTQYVNLGVNGSAYSAPGVWTINGANDAYLYASDGELAVGTASNKPLDFFTGGLLAANNRMSISGTGSISMTGANATLLTAGANGATNPALTVDSSTASSAAGWAVKSSAAGASTTGATSLTVTSSGTNENGYISAKGTGTLTLNSGNTVATTIGNNLIMGVNQSGFNTTSNFGGFRSVQNWRFTGSTDSSLTASADVGVFLVDGGQVKTHATGAIATQRDIRFIPSTHAFVAASTITNAAGLAVDGAPIASTNATISNSSTIYSAGSAVGAGVTNSYGINVAANTGATNNYAARFDGNTQITDNAIIPNTPATGIVLSNLTRVNEGRRGQINIYGEYSRYSFSDADKRKILWQATGGGSTTTSSYGTSAATIGAAAGVGVTTTTAGGAVKRLSYTTAATAATQAGVNLANTSFRGGTAGLGGFYGKFTGGISTYVAGMAMFIGFANAGTFTVDTSTLLNMFGIGLDAADTNLQFMTNDGSGVATKVDLGANFAANATDVYEIELGCGPAATTAYYYIRNLTTGIVATGSASADLPAATATFGGRIWCNTVALTSAVGVAAGNIYIESRY